MKRAFRIYFQSPRGSGWYYGHDWNHMEDYEREMWRVRVRSKSVEYWLDQALNHGPLNSEDYKTAKTALMEATMPDQQPVSVSLEKRTLAYCHADYAFDMNTYSEKKPHTRGIEMAKAVLDAAGVAYVD